jgi:hypothetical protein
MTNNKLRQKKGKEFTDARARNTIQNDSLTRLLAICGIVSSILINVVILAFGLLRPGYDPI